jgi:hypothetical protein
MDGLLRVLDLDHAWLPFGSGGLNEEGRTRRLPLQPCFSVYFYSTKLDGYIRPTIFRSFGFWFVGVSGFWPGEGA